MSTKVGSLELEILSNTKGAVSGLDRLSETLGKLRSACKGGAGLSSVAKNMEKLSKVLRESDFSGASDKITELVTALQPLGGLAKSSLTSTVNALRKLPDAMKGIDTRKLYTQIQSLTRIMQPLAVEMEKIARGFAAFPSRIQNLIKANTKLNTSQKKVNSYYKKASSSQETLQKVTDKSALSFVNLAAKISITYMAMRRIVTTVSSFIKKSSDYVENVNLFTVAMGEYADAAKSYAESVGEILGIDPGEWMRNQGVFMTLATGFGVATDRAAVMSEQLTQLGYDISSFFNIDVGDAMQKLQSGLSGELEPLRRIGYDLSQAKLEATALALGIDKSVASMTQAEKAQLRYYAIMTQVTTAHGDMARTLDAPANQMRIFKAQVEQAGRAIGNIFIPALNKILPYAIAVAEVIRYVANAIAGLVGYEFPEIDYSGIGAVAGGAEDADDALDDAAKSAKKLKSYLLGFDELNIISPNDDGGASELEDTLSQFNFELPTYDFVGKATQNRVAQIVKKMKEWLGFTKKIESWSDFIDTDLGNVLVNVGAIGLALGAWKIGTAVTAFFKMLAGTSLVSAFLDGFALIRATGGSVFQALTGGLTNIRYNLGLLPKLAITAVAGFIEFNVVQKTFEDLVKGNENLLTGIGKIAGVVALAAAAMYAAFGPAGVAVAGVVFLVGAIAGITEAHEEMRKEIVNAAFFDGVGTSLDTLKGKLESVTGEYEAQNKQIGIWKDEIATNHDTIDTLSLKIETLGTTLGTTGTVTEEEVKTIKEEFGKLYDSISTNMKLSEEMITTALVGALKRATPEIAGQIDILIGEYQRYVRETSGRAEELKLLIDNGYDQLVGKQKDDPAYQAIMENIRGWYTELGYLEGGMSDAAWQWEQAVAKFDANEIDFGEDLDSATKAIGEIASTGKTALEDLATARDSVLKEIDESIRYATQYGSLEDVQLLGDVRKAIEDDYANQEKAIKEGINSIFESIQEGMIGKLDTTKANLEKEWDDMNWFEHWWYDNDEEKYVLAGLQDFQKNVDTISKAIEDHMGDLETDGSVWASDAMHGIIGALFDSEIVRNDLTGGTAKYSYKTSLENAIKQTFTELETSGKKSSSETGKEITNGLSEGITSKIPEVDKAGKLIVEKTDAAVRAAAQIQSPSKLFAENGGYIVDGLIQGIEEKLIALKESVATVITSVLSKSSATSFGVDFGKNLAKGVADGFKSMSFPTLKGTVNVTDGGSASLTLRAYANGGFPETGQMFIAREAGAEMVGSIGRRTAVANNDQIVDGIANGVAEANGEQTSLLREQNTLLRALLEKESGVYLDGRSLTNSVEKYQRERGRVLITGGVV